MRSKVVKGSFSTSSQYNESTLADKNRVLSQYLTEDGLLQYMDMEFVQVNPQFLQGLRSLEKPSEASNGAKRKHFATRPPQAKKRKTH